MKKNVKKVCILSLILITISFVITVLFGNTYTVSFNIRDNNYKFNIENASGEVKVLEKKEVKNKYIVKVKSKKEGKVYLNLVSDISGEIKVLYIHKSMLITDNNYFGKSTGSEIFPISLSIVLIYILYLLIKRYNKLKKENLYQYKNIANLGIIIFVSFFTLSDLIISFKPSSLIIKFESLFLI